VIWNPDQTEVKDCLTLKPGRLLIGRLKFASSKEWHSFVSAYLHDVGHKEYKKVCSDYWDVIEDLTPDILVGDLNADQHRLKYEGDERLKSYVENEKVDLGEGKERIDWEPAWIISYAMSQLLTIGHLPAL
jgi:hypothetical protein